MFGLRLAARQNLRDRPQSLLNNTRHPMTLSSSLAARVLVVSLAVLTASAAPAAAQTPAPVPPQPPPAAPAGPKPIALGNDIVFATAIRTRTYGWDWFGDADEGDYTYQGTQIRFGVTQTRKKYDWQLEFEAPFMINLPTTAVKPPPQGQLGLGASYYAANGNSENPIHLFLKQGTIRFKGLGGIAGQSLKVGRFEFNDALEVTPRNPSIVVLNRDRVSQRILGNFGFSDVLRSFDGAQYTLAMPKYTITGVAARPTEGVFQVNGWNELDINVFYGSVMGNSGTDKNPRTWRVLGMGYHDYRDNAPKTDNRPAAVRNADTKSINIATFGGHVIQLVGTSSGPVDLMFWGVGQTGSWGALSHRASAMAAEIGWQPSALRKLKPWLRAAYNYDSGDSNPNDNKHGTFMQMLPTARIYARTPFFNLMDTVDAFGEVILRPHPRLTLRSDVHQLTLASKNDLWYSGGGAFQPNTFGMSGRPSNGHSDLSTLIDLSGDIIVNRNATLGLYYGHASSGAIAKAIYPSGDALHLAFMEWLIRF
jgi:hypothetical protein